MTDTTPLTAIDRLQGNDTTGNNLLTDISRSLGLKSDKDQRSERWKEKLRAELVREHLAAQQEKQAPVKSRLRKLFRLN